MQKKKICGAKSGEQNNNYVNDVDCTKGTNVVHEFFFCKMYSLCSKSKIEEDRGNI